jgi:hypothetical protein
MKLLRALVVVSLTWSAPALPIAAQSRLEVALDPPDATVGDPVAATLTLSSTLADETAPIFPDWGEKWGEAEILETGPVERIETATGFAHRQRLRIAAYRTGRIDLPPVVVRTSAQASLEVRSPAVALEIRSVLPDGDSVPEPQPPRPVLLLPVPRAFFWLAGGLSLLAVASAAAIAAGRRRRLAATIESGLAPLAELEHELESIRCGEASAGHVALSLALRRYLGRALSVPAPASTTREIGRRLDRRGLDSSIARRAARLLSEVDQVKFARHACDTEDLVTRSTRALEIAGRIEDHLREPSAEIGA